LGDIVDSTGPGERDGEGGHAVEDEGSRDGKQADDEDDGGMNGGEMERIFGGKGCFVGGGGEGEDEVVCAGTGRGRR